MPAKAGPRVFFSTKLPCHAATFLSDNHLRPTEPNPLNPNGSPLGLTALTTTNDRVTIMMHHPERVFRSACMSYAAQTWGEDSPRMKFFDNARAWVG